MKAGKRGARLWDIFRTDYFDPEMVLPYSLEQFSAWRRPHRRWTFTSLLAVVFLVALPTVHGQSPADEYRLKAAFIYRFPQFVDWPLNVLDGRRAIELCVLAPNPFGAVLQELVAGDTLRGRLLVVRHIEDEESIDACHVLFLPTASRTRRAVLQQVAGLPILTVGDAPSFLDEGGIVQLRLIDNRVRFEIDASAAGRAGLRLSSQLLRLAVRVRGVPT
jgi:hypothetical protein